MLIISILFFAYFVASLLVINYLIKKYEDSEIRMREMKKANENLVEKLKLKGL